MRVSINWPEASWWQWPLLLARLLTVSGSRTRIWASTGSLHLSMSDVSLCQRCPALLIRKLLDKADSFGQSSHYSCIDIIDYQGWGWVNRIFRSYIFIINAICTKGRIFSIFFFFDVEKTVKLSRCSSFNLRNACLRCDGPQCSGGIVITPWCVTSLNGPLYLIMWLCHG